MRQSSAAAKILLVEDEAVIALKERELLESRGFSVAVAHTGRSAIKQVREDPEIALILLDIHLGDGSDTSSICSEIEKIRELPIVILTAYTDRRVMEEVGGITQYGYVVKNSGDYVLIESVRKALELFEAHRKTRKSEQLYLTILSNISDAVFLTEESGRFIFICPNVDMMFGYSVEEAEALGNIAELFGGPVVKKEELDSAVEVGNIERRIRDKTGVERIVLINVKRVDIGSGTRLYTCRDITTLRRKESALRESEQKYKDLAAHLQLLQEEHEQHIGRELHDGLGQDLALLRMGLLRLMKDGKVPAEAIRPVVTNVAGIIESVRTVVSNLRAFPLDEFGLQAAIEERLEAVERSTGMVCSVGEMPFEIKAPPHVLQGVYKIFQEALANVLRHASATKLQVSLTLRDNVLYLEMSDNGCGFREEETTGASSFGLLGMFERTELLGGNLTIFGNPGEGTEIFLKIPVNKSLQGTIR